MSDKLLTPIEIGLTAAIVAIEGNEPMILIAAGGEPYDLAGLPFGPFDAVASLGAFEHFCSPEDYRAGRQERIYRDLFERVASVLPEGGRMYLQTMVFGRNMVPQEQIDIRELTGLPPRDSDTWYLALLGRQFPGSWLPFGQEQLARCAEPHFRLVSSSNGRGDYIETIRQWNARIGTPSVRKTLLKLALLPRSVTTRT